MDWLGRPRDPPAFLALGLHLHTSHQCAQRASCLLCGPGDYTASHMVGRHLTAALCPLPLGFVCLRQGLYTTLAVLKLTMWNKLASKLETTASAS